MRGGAVGFAQGWTLMTALAYVRGNGNGVVGGGLVKEFWVCLADADREALRSQEVLHR
ncbi:hypothetical protein TIFTF001_032684 [Ficus carica]|uniref:Uncharacterized protein n=1 Tax=Ficus carica TaxID=3494 RepID=A0AA88J707_FICCA|nr:hypothetical protein TIFTF001_032684 [Ficus carica]